MTLMQIQAVQPVRWRWLGGPRRARVMRELAPASRRRVGARWATILALHAAALAAGVAFSTAIRVEGLERFSPVAGPVGAGPAVAAPVAVAPAVATAPSAGSPRTRVTSGRSVATLAIPSTAGPLRAPDRPGTSE